MTKYILFKLYNANYFTYAENKKNYIVGVITLLMLIYILKVSIKKLERINKNLRIILCISFIKMVKKILVVFLNENCSITEI